MYDQFTLPVSTSSPTISVFTEIRISSEKPTFTLKFFKGACSHQDEIIAMQKNTTKRKLIRSIIYFFINLSVPRTTLSFSGLDLYIYIYI